MPPPPGLTVAVVDCEKTPSAARMMTVMAPAATRAMINQTHH